MRIGKANSSRQRSRRSWRIPNAVEQAGVVGKWPAIPGHDRPPLDPIFGSDSNCACVVRNSGLNRRQPCKVWAWTNHIGLTNGPPCSPWLHQIVPHEGHIL